MDADELIAAYPQLFHVAAAGTGSHCDSMDCVALTTSWAQVGCRLRRPALSTMRRHRRFMT